MTYDAGIMKTRRGWLQSYNGQIVVTAGRVRWLRFSGQVDKRGLAGRERSQRWV